MRDKSLGRRRFLVAAIALFGAGTVGPSGLRLGRAWAQSSAQLDASTKNAMVRMARLLFPHDAIADEVYADALDAALTATAADASFAQTLRQAESVLDRQGATAFAELDEAAQLAALRAVEREAFFSAIQFAVRSRFYNHPTVWEHLGYGGPSFAQGGYLNRGAGEVDWLTERE